MNAKENLTNIQTWIRGVFFVVLGVIFYFAFGLFIWILVLVQFLFKLFTGNVNPQLLEFSKHATAYAHHILRYVTYQTDDVPPPLSYLSVPKSQEQAGGGKPAAPKNADRPESK
jgi:hypothetical protein